MKTFKSFFLWAVVLCFSANAGFSQQPLTFLSYNILEGLKSDSILKADFTGWVKIQNPDIVAFQETNKFTQRSLETFASGYGHPYAILAKETGYPVALTSKYPIVNVQKVLDNMWHGYIYAQIQEYHIFVLHLSPHNQKKRELEITQLIAHAKTLPKNSKIIFSGDFNALSAKDAAQYNDNLLANMREAESKAAHIRNLKNGQIDYGILNAMEQAKYTDVFNHVNKKFQYSIPTKKYAQPNSIPRRIDFIMVSSNLVSRITEAQIIHDQHTDYLSDHYPVIMKLK